MRIVEESLLLLMQRLNVTHTAVLPLLLLFLCFHLSLRPSLSTSHMIQHFMIQHTFCVRVCVCHAPVSLLRDR